MKTPPRASARVLALVAAVTATVLVAPVGPASGSDDASRRHSHRQFLVWSRYDNFDDGTARLVARRVGGHDVVVLTHPPTGVQDIDPRISPNGRRILFERDFADRSEAWLVRSDGTGEHKIDLGCTNLCGTNAPAWTTDGRHLLYDRVSGPFDEDGTAASANLWKARLDGSHNHHFSDPRLTPSTEEIYPTFAPAGYLVVLHGRRDGHNALFRERADGTHARRLTQWNLDADLPQVSPARRGPTRDLIVFETYGHGAPDSHTIGQQVATVPATCRTVRRCTAQIRYLTASRQPADDFNPAWSPNGRRITYVHFQSDTVDPPAVGDIWTMRWNGRDKRPFSQDRRFEYRPAWGRVR